MRKDEFSEKIGRFTKSNAYLQYCQEVYGYREYLFNMMDKQQLDFLLNAVPISAEDTLLDLGCGSGSILKLLVTKYGCRGIGMDRLDPDILNFSSKLTYLNADLDRISDYDTSPTITLSIDSLYFSKDLTALMRQLNRVKNNRMYLFYSQYLFDEAAGDKRTLQSDHTKVADALQYNDISFHTIDYSENERSLYQNSLEALQRHRKAFEAEGNTDLYEQKVQQDLLGMELYNKGLASRYLYIVNGV